ncbi:solute carrier family 13 member 2-like [Glandiceps talaboti]
MAVFWITEAFPLSVTALLPLVLFPLMGVLTASKTATVYLKDTNVLFIGGVMVAVAVKHWNLHKRIALRVLLLVGSGVRGLMLGFMIPTALLSMFISNTATTAMMTPIAQAVLSELVTKPAAGGVSRKLLPQTEQHEQTQHTMNADLEMDPINDRVGGKYKLHEDILDEEDLEGATSSSEEISKEGLSNSNRKPVQISHDGNDQMSDFDRLSPSDQRMSKALVICIAFAANIGGTATLTGTGTNIVLIGILEGHYGNDHGVDFASWFIYSFPGMVLFEFIAWLWLQFWFLRCNGGCYTGCPCTSRADNAKRVIRQQYNELGPMTWAEGAVLVHFIMLALLWMTRDISGYGWGNLFTEGYVSDSTPAIFIAVSLFIFPSHPPNCLCCRRRNDNSKKGPQLGLLDWKIVHHKLPWGIVLLFGGGFALAEGCKASGLSQWIGDQLVVLGDLSVEVIILTVTTIVCFFTEVTSNMAIATIFLPILASLGESICVNPLHLMIPSTIICSYAFMLPVATPPNAIVFSYGQLKVLDMATVGFVLNILGILLVNMWLNIYGDVIFDLKTYPTWAAGENSTCIAFLNSTTN